MEAQEQPLIIAVDYIFNPHCHLRELSHVAALIALAVEGGTRIFGPMPNTNEGLKTYREVINYIEYARALDISKEKWLQFIPIAVITHHTTVVEILECVRNDVVDFKIYPYLRTTKSEKLGVVDYCAILQVVKQAARIAFQKHGRRLRIHFHPEDPWMVFGNRDAEYAFLPTFKMFLDQVPEAIMIWEHGTDIRCILFWKDMAEMYPGRFYLTITAHHLASNEDIAFGDVRQVCKPPLRPEPDRLSLVALVMEGHSWVMLGADDAPHDVDAKHPEEGRCACGDYTSPFLIQLCAHALDALLLRGVEGIRIFNGFICKNAEMLYGLFVPPGELRLQRTPFVIPKGYHVEVANFPGKPWYVQSFWAGQKLLWSLAKAA